MQTFTTLTLKKLYCKLKQRKEKTLTILFVSFTSNHTVLSDKIKVKL